MDNIFDDGSNSNQAIIEDYMTNIEGKSKDLIFKEDNKGSIVTIPTFDKSYGLDINKTDAVAIKSSLVWK